MDKKIRVAVDGPSGVGKSTTAKIISAELGIDYVDTGAMYRAVALKMKEKGVGTGDIKGIEQMLSSTEIDFSKGDVILDGKIINELIRTQEISKLASDCSALLPVREKLVAMQRETGNRKSVVMDGRDIGTNVLKDAEFKFYLTAAKEERARRRFKELSEKGQKTTFEEVLKDITARDINDMTRELNPLRKADDAIEIDTTEMAIEEVRDYILDVIKGEKNGND